MMMAAASQACPADSRRLDRRDGLTLLIVSAVGCAVWLWFALSTRVSLEDGYITFRYAVNIVRGNGFVYNVGERVLGTTTPLQTVLLAGLGAVLGPGQIPVIAAVVMPIFGIAAGIVAYCALVRLGISRVGAAAGCLLFYLHPLVVRTSLGGMETPLVLFLMAFSLYFLSKKQSVAATAAIGLLAVCRVDGLIWGVVIAGVMLLSKYRKPLQQAAAFGAIVIPWVVFAFVYFGSPAPNSMLAKGAVRPGREMLLLRPEHFTRTWRWYVSGTGFGWDESLLPIWIGLLGIGTYAVLRRRRPELLPLVIFPPVYAVVLYLGRAPRVQWYLLPMLLCCMLLGGVGIGTMLSWIAERKLGWPWRAAAAIVAGAALIPPARSLADYLPRHVRHTRLFQENEFGLRRAVGLWLREHTPQDASVAMEAIGYQGFFSERRVIDMAGLVTPRVVEFEAGTGSNGVVFRRITTELKPDYIVLRSFEVDQNRHFKGGRLFETPSDREWFFRHYGEARRFVAPHPRLTPLLTRLTVYERKAQGRREQ